MHLKGNPPRKLSQREERQKAKEHKVSAKGYLGVRSNGFMAILQESVRLFTMRSYFNVSNLQLCGNYPGWVAAVTDKQRDNPNMTNKVNLKSGQLTAQATLHVMEQCHIKFLDRSLLHVIERGIKLKKNLSFYWCI